MKPNEQFDEVPRRYKKDYETTVNYNEELLFFLTVLSQSNRIDTDQNNQKFLLISE